MSGWKSPQVECQVTCVVMQVRCVIQLGSLTAEILGFLGWAGCETASLSVRNCCASIAGDTLWQPIGYRQSGSAMALIQHFVSISQLKCWMSGLSPGGSKNIG